MNVTALGVARRFEGLSETAGSIHNAAVLAMLQLVDRSVQTDETAWCSAFVHYVAWVLDLQRARSLAARSWLHVGTEVTLAEAQRGFDIVVLARGARAPGPDVLDAPGHVGFYVSRDPAALTVNVFGGNQGDRVCEEPFPVARVLSVRRLAPLAPAAIAAASSRPA